ncbi:MAG: tryptophan synthase subunit beta [Mangrovibacterium sp.]
MNFQPDKKGYYGNYGGAFIPEMMHPNIDELQKKYLEITNSYNFRMDFIHLLKHYVGRPSPLYLAKRLSEKYNTNIFLKREDLNHTGSHKINNTIGQILLAKALGRKRIIAETGAGQHGVATATVCALMNMQCVVYMGALDVKRQAPNVKKMRMLGAEVRPAESGNKTLKDACNEAMRDWISNPEDTYYIIGSAVGPHPYPDMVARFHSVISEEMKWQLDEQMGRENPTRVIACVGGGSNAAGSFYHFLDQPDVELIGVEAAGLGIDTTETAATLTLGKPGYLHASRSYLLQTDDGQVVEPYSISAGLDYPGIGPLHSHLKDTQRAKYLAATDDEALAAVLELTRLEGIIPAMESAHALAGLPKIDMKPDDINIVTLSGRGDKDMETYLDRLGYNE